LSKNSDGNNSSATVVISSSSVAFGSVEVGQTASASVSVTNNGSSPVQLSTPQITGQYFSLSGQSSGTASIGAGSSQTFDLQFAPMTAGTQTGSMTMSAGGTTLTVALSGSGTAAPGALSGLACASGSMTAAGTDNCTVTLNAQAGSGGLTVGLSSSSTAVAVPASVTVPAGAVSFTATISAVTTAQTVHLTATAGTVTESFTLQLGAAVPALTLQSTSVAFGGVSLNSPATQTVLLTSSGTAALTISAALATGAGFGLTGPSFPMTLQPGQTATLDIQFAPTAAGAAIGTVTLTTNAPGGTAKISLTGTGQAASYAVDLSWNAPTNSSDPVTGYDVYRAVSGSTSYLLVNSSVDDVASYSDTTVQSATAYTYYVVSVDASGNQSAPSDLFSVTVP
jgi:hypothetical protein